MTESTKVKLAPHSKESEMMVLGCMLTSTNSLHVAAKSLDAEDFFFTEHKIIFQVLKEAYDKNKPSDIHLICEELKRQEKLPNVGGVAKIAELAQYVGTSAYIEEYIKIVRDKTLLRRLIFASQTVEKAAFSDPEDIQKVLKNAASVFEELQQNGRSGGIDPKIIQPYTLNDLKDELNVTKEGLKTGFASLDETVRIRNEAITLVAGRPAHGKTTLMLNLFINLIRQYPDLHFYFFSYEETRQQIAVKIINILSEHVFNESQNLSSLEGYLKLGLKNAMRVEQGKKEFQELVDKGRLRIIGHPYYVQELSTQIAYLKDKGVPLGAVFIDYVQKIKNKGKFGTRQLELADTSTTILEMAKSCSLPIVMGVQLGRGDKKDKVTLDNLRECGDLENDANLVLGLHNPSMEKSQAEQIQITGRDVELHVTPLKNRNGIANKTVYLIFDRPVLKIITKEEKEKRNKEEKFKNTNRNSE